MAYPYKVGDMLFMQPRSEDEPETYKARIVDLKERHICIEIPMRKGGEGLGFFPQGTELDVWFTGRDQLRYQFVSQVAGRKMERIPLTLLTHPNPETIVRIQQRQFFRVPCHADVQLYVHDDQTHPLSATTVDLSGGGMAFVLAGEQQLQVEDEVKWELFLPSMNGSSVSGRAVVKRVIPPEDKGLPYKYSLAFTEIAEQGRQQIIRYCFQRQLELRKKELDTP
ncbi:c-di-GMP-binding flagellar brake protein YcgR [Caldalkalibacillus uzonensis]|uniref:C-di-GMP-binding flagellar brake protein YcgR n=1 Tax=Caldalkalibacillus uzonensis TaxID=353224 RepID=A0ABU0CMX0_9BACI|nr:PilZ domain-containing protein [Caldalkalibacillus uzonensis]MDQ0337765.1 c-di-GMP-binding flagellar brake protein YcgR [Caldalkalibacillus uzonensis]